MRIRAVAAAVGAATIAAAFTMSPRAMGKPGVIPVPCPNQQWQTVDPAFDEPLRPNDPGGVRISPASKPSGQP